MMDAQGLFAGLDKMPTKLDRQYEAEMQEKARMIDEEKQKACRPSPRP